MLLSEFVERTKYEPSAEEYSYIEDSYYEFVGDKDEFCKDWLKRKKNHAWRTELSLRTRLNALEKDYKQQLSEKEEELSWYRTQYDMLTARGLKVIVKCKGERPKAFDDVTVHYVDNGTIRFYSIKQKSGWTTCYKVDDVESIEFKF